MLDHTEEKLASERLVRKISRRETMDSELRDRKAEFEMMSRWMSI